MPETLRILIIDDGRDARRSCEILLGRMGYEIRTAEDGPQGLSVCREFKPDVVLCDIGLTPEMSGYDVAREVRAMPEMAAVYLVAQTGFSRDEDIDNAHQAGFNLHLKKPVDFDRLTTLLDELKSRMEP